VFGQLGEVSEFPGSQKRADPNVGNSSLGDTLAKTSSYSRNKIWEAPACAHSGRSQNICVGRAKGGGKVEGHVMGACGEGAGDLETQTSQKGRRTEQARILVSCLAGYLKTDDYGHSS